uniref:Uncharacterized protein n=1 Tax=Ralstonia solanacearum CFBP2957 TaxID=859656 RepID=D8P6W0_RALSL|nr:protein of unknown function [Ralstonia solanacearum CFBP2957]
MTLSSLQPPCHGDAPRLPPRPPAQAACPAIAFTCPRKNNAPRQLPRAITPSSKGYMAHVTFAGPHAVHRVRLCTAENVRR